MRVDRGDQGYRSWCYEAGENRVGPVFEFTLKIQFHVIRIGGKKRKGNQGKKGIAGKNGETAEAQYVKNVEQTLPLKSGS